MRVNSALFGVVVSIDCVINACVAKSLHGLFANMPVSESYVRADGSYCKYG